MSGHALDPNTGGLGQDPSERRARRTLWRRKTAVLGFVGIGALLLVAATAPWLAPYDPGAQDLSRVLAPPVWAGGDGAHLLGTDAVGRDVLSRLIHGARSSVVISVCAMLLGGTLGVLTGLVSGFYGRIVDTILMRLGDIQLALPFILIAIVILGMMNDRDPIHLILVLGIPAWIVYARVVRSKVLSEREQAYVRSAQALGASRRRQMFRYVLPQAWTVVPAIALIDLSHLVVMEATLSFLGFGLTPPSVSWGQILADGRQNMVTSPWLPVLPGLAIMVTILSINLAVEGLRGDVQPRRRWLTAPRRSRGAGPAPSGRPGAPRAASDAAEGGAGRALLEVTDLAVEFPTADGVIEAVRGVSFEARRGQVLGIVGESGSGKSVTANAIMGLLTPPGQVTRGSIVFDGTELVDLRESRLRQLRGRRIGMIFQNPVGSLNPVLTVGYQLAETVRTHRDIGRAAARRVAEDALREVGFADPSHVMRQFPFRLSGGQNQRVMIAMTMVVEPELVLADEPTTALDVTTQSQVIELLLALRDAQNTSIVLVSHDIGLIGEVADEVLVMYAGQIVERGPTESLLATPQHPYSSALLASVPRPSTAGGDLASVPGEPPEPIQLPQGCPFADRCDHEMDVCRSLEPELWTVGRSHGAACHLHRTAEEGASRP